ncbi:MAG: hypothetical protein ACTSP4_04930 [Candidatus Hodarchaeales archaeon]
MVYKLSTMKFTTKIFLFFILIVISSISGVIGASVIVSTNFIPNAQFEIDDNPVIDEILEDLGEFQDYYYWNSSEAIGIALNIQFDESYERGYMITTKDFPVPNLPVPGIDIKDVEIYFENGSVIYEREMRSLRYFLFDSVSGNMTVYEVDALEKLIYLDTEDHIFRLHFDLMNNPELTKRRILGDGKEVLEPLGSYFEVRSRPILQWISAVIGELLEIGTDIIRFGIPLLTLVAVGAIAGLVTSVFFSIIRINRLFSNRWSYFVVRRLRGKIGRLLSFVPIFDLGGIWYVEESFVDIIDLSRVRTSLSELLKERWYDVLFFPTALASIIIYAVLLVVPEEYKFRVLMMSPLFSPLVLLFLVIYYPIVWATDEGGLRKCKMSEQGDVVAVKPIGSILRDGLGVVVGFSGIISVASMAVNLPGDFAREEVGAGQMEVAGIGFDVVGIVLLVLWTFGLFFVLMASMTVGACIVAISYLESCHLSTIKYIRTKSEKDGLISNFGSVTMQFSPKGIDVVMTKDNVELSSGETKVITKPVEVEKPVESTGFDEPAGADTEPEQPSDQKDHSTGYSEENTDEFMDNNEEEKKPDMDDY